MRAVVQFSVEVEHELEPHQLTALIELVTLDIERGFFRPAQWSGSAMRRVTVRSSIGHDVAPSEQAESVERGRGIDESNARARSAAAE